jgi:predicted esterase
MLPVAAGTCPTFTNGTQATLTAGTQTIKADVWMGSTGGGPIVFYWHGTGSSATLEVPTAFDTSAVVSAGGIVIGPEVSTRTGTPTGNTGDDVWYQSDAAFMDQGVACALQQLHADPRHIHTAGYSAGALQAVYMWYARSGYVASIISYSGGDVVINTTALQDPSNIPAAIVAHGGAGQDTYGTGTTAVDFSKTSAAWESVISGDHGTYIDCNDGGNHLAFFSTRAPNLKPVSLQFFLDHPFGVTPEPYTTLPTGYPAYCALDGAGQAP